MVTLGVHLLIQDRSKGLTCYQKMLLEHVYDRDLSVSVDVDNLTEKIASWLVSSVLLVSLQQKLRLLSFVSRCSHFRCGLQRLDCLILEVVICRGGRQITLFLLKHITVLRWDWRI